MMLKEDFSEITKEHLISAKDLVKFEGDCVGARIKCMACPFRRTNTKKYRCYAYDLKKITYLAKEFVKTFGDK